MSLIQTAPSVATIEKRTRQQLMKRFLREAGLGITGTATGGSTTTLVDTGRLNSTQYNDRQWFGGFARIPYDAGGAADAPELDIRPVTTFAPATGTATVNAAWSGASSVASGDTYELWYAVHPQIVLDALDSILVEECFLPCWSLLTFATDGDMEQNNTTDWTAASATHTKVTTEPSLSGVRWSSVLTTAANGYIRPVVFRVEPNRRYHISVLARANAASVTCKLVAFDATNSAEIDSVTSMRQQAVRMWMEVTTPATCYQMQVRLQGVENNVTCFFDDLVVYPIDTQTIPLPWWVKNSTQVKGIFRLRPVDLAADLWDAALTGYRATEWDNITDSAFGGGQLYLTNNSRQGMSAPLYVKGTRNETAYANENTENKHVDSNFIMAALGYRVFQHLSSYPMTGDPSVNNNWVDKQLARFSASYQKEQRRQLLRLEVEDHSPQIDALYYRDSYSERMPFAVRGD